MNLIKFDLAEISKILNIDIRILKSMYNYHGIIYNTCRARLISQDKYNFLITILIDAIRTKFKEYKFFIKKDISKQNSLDQIINYDYNLEDLELINSNALLLILFEHLSFNAPKYKALNLKSYETKNNIPSSNNNLKKKNKKTKSIFKQKKKAVKNISKKYYPGKEFFDSTSQSLHAILIPSGGKNR